jgi:ubiquinol-cytochrome c reductase cytochrome b subunit
VCYHFLLPLVLCGVVLLHLLLLHEVNSTGESYMILSRCDRINFYPLLLVRDLFVGACFLIGYLWFVCFDSDLMGHPDNYVPANPMVTPAEIMPVWYFLPFYAILRAVPHKALGIVILAVVLVGFMNLMSEASHFWSGKVVL